MGKTLNEQLNWRYATKKMDPTRTVAQEKIEAIIEAIRMSPTSSGTQPFELIVVTNKNIREEICKAASNQTPIIDGSHLLVFAAWDNYTEARIDEVADLNVKLRGDLPLIGQYYGNLKV
jgi:nitroreductase